MQFRTKLLLWLMPPFILFTATAGLYFFSPQIAEYALQRWLQKQNFSSIELNMQPPGWNQLHIESATLVKQGEDKEIRYSVSGLTLGFNPVEMFSQHELNELLIQKAAVQISYNHLPQSTQPDEPIDLSQALPSRWFDQMPVDLLRIGELQLQLNYPEGTSDWQFIGAINFTHKQLTSRVHFQRDEQPLGWADLEARANDHFNLRLLDNDQPILVINGDLSFEQGLRLESRQLIELNGFLNWQKKLLGSQQPLPNLTGSVSTSGTTNFPLKTQFSPDALLASFQTQQTLDAHLQVIDPSSEIKSADLLLAGDLEFEDNFLNINLNNQSKVSAEGIKLGFTEKPLAQVLMTLPQGLKLTTNLSPVLRGELLSPVISPTSIKVETPQIELKEGTLAATETQVKLQKVDLQAKTVIGHLSNDSLNLHIPNQTVPSITLDLAFTLQDNNLKGNYSLTSTELPLALKGSIASDIQADRSTFDWTLAPVALKNIDRSLANFLAIPAELSISAGTLFHKGSGTLRNGKLTAQAYNSIRSGEFSWEDYRFNKLDWDSTSRLTASGKILDKGSVKLQQAKTGVDITEIETGYEFKLTSNSQLLSLKKTKARLLQGTISIAPVSFDPFQPDIETSVSVDQVDLGEVLSLEQQEGLSGEGKLSGSFPVTLKNGELTIEDGGLFSLDPGGKILFAPNPSVLAYAATNVGLKMALEALENFHFDTLDIKLNYSKDGTAHLNTRLKGNNPDWNNGHPVDFTINIEENIPKLLQALQFTEKLTKTIEKRYR